MKRIRIFLGITLFLLFFLKFYLFYHNYNKFHEIVEVSSFLIYLILCGLIIWLFIKRKWTISVNVSLIFFLLILLEFISYFMLGLPIKQWKGFDVLLMPEGHKNNYMGNIPWGDSVIHDVQLFNGDTFVDTYYSIDSLNRRITPGFDSSKSNHAIFFGCSVCFGFGLKDDETIPYFFQKNTTKYNSYNYAYNGYGPNHMLSLLEHDDLSQQVNEQAGVGFYLFIWSHIRRAIGDYQVYTEWGHTMPYYSLEHGELKYGGNFTQRPYISKLYEVLYKSYTVKNFGLNFPVNTNRKHYELVADIIHESKKVYLTQFPKDEFVVLIYPDKWEELNDGRIELFLAELEERGIKYIDFSEYDYLKDPEYIIEDGHPNSKSNKLFSQFLVKAME